MKKILSFILVFALLFNTVYTLSANANVSDYIFTDSIGKLSVNDGCGNGSFNAAYIYNSSSEGGTYDPAVLNEEKTRGFFVIDEGEYHFIRMIGSGYINQDTGTTPIKFTPSEDTTGVFEAVVRLSNSSGFRVTFNGYQMSVPIPEEMLDQWTVIKLYMQPDGSYNLYAGDSLLSSGKRNEFAALFAEESTSVHRIRFMNSYSSGETGRIMDIAKYYVYELRENETADITISGPQNIEIPSEDTVYEYNYAAVALNYKGMPLNKNIEWALDRVYAGITIDDGTLYVENVAQNGTVGITASADGFTKTYNVTLEGQNDNYIAESFAVMPDYTQEGIEYNVTDTDGMKSTFFDCGDNSKRLVYGYNFRAGRVYLIKINMSSDTENTGVTFSLIRPDSAPAREFLSNRVTFNSEYKTVTMHYKCGDDSIPDNKLVPGYIAFYSNTENATLKIRSVEITEVTSGYNPAYSLPFEVSNDVVENKDIITRLVFNDYMPERDNGFCPDDAVTKAEIVRSVVSVGGYSPVSYSGAFSDVSSVTKYSGYIQKAYNLGLIEGTNFYPENDADAEFIMDVCTRLYKSVSSKNKSYEQLGLPAVSGNSITRNKAAEIIYKFLSKVRDEGLEDAFIAWAENAISTYTKNGMNEEAAAFQTELDEFIEADNVAKNTESNYLLKVNDFYKNPYSKKILNDIVKCGVNSNGYKYISVGESARNQFKVFTAPKSIIDQTECLLWGMLSEDSHYCGNKYSLTYVLSNLEILTYIIKDGNSQYYFTSSDSNYNMFFFQEYMYCYMIMKEYYPCFLLPSMQEKIEGILKQAIKYQEENYEDYGKGYYANIDVMLANMYAYMGIIFDDESYKSKADEILNNVAATIYPDGGVPYIGSENEIQSYHNNILKDVGMNFLVTKSTAAQEFLKKTVNYYPKTLDSNLFAEYSTALIFKQNWSNTTLIPGVSVASYFETDGKNKAIENKSISLNPYAIGSSYQGAVVAGAFYKEDTAEDITVFDDGIVTDENIGGARGKWGDFSYSLDFRNRALREGYPATFPGNGIHKSGTYAGKSTYVGAYVSDEYSYGGLKEAVSKVYSSVQYADSSNIFTDRTNVSNYSDEWFESGSDYAAAGATYSLGTYGASSMTYTNLDGFLGHEIWYAKEDRIVGVLVNEAIDDSDIYAQSSIIQLICGSANEYDVLSEADLVENGDGSYTYGSIGIKIHDTNYDDIYVDYDSKVINTNINKANSKDAIDIVLETGQDTQYSVSAGEYKYAVVEIYNTKDTLPLENVSFNENDGIYVLSVNDKNILYNLSQNKVISQNKEYTHGTGAVLDDYEIINNNDMKQTLYTKNFDEDAYTVGNKGYYTGDPSDNSANNVLFYDSASDLTQNPTPHFEIRQENDDKYLTFKVKGIDQSETGNVKTYFLQLSNLQYNIPYNVFNYENSNATIEHFNVEFDIRYNQNSDDSALRIEFYQNNEDNSRGASTAVVMNCSDIDKSGTWVSCKLTFDKRARKIYLYCDNTLTQTYNMSAGTDIFKNGINLIRIYYRGANTDGSFVKDAMDREISIDNFNINIPVLTYKNAVYDNTGNFCAQILNNTFEEQNVKLIRAVYDNEKIVEIAEEKDVKISPMTDERVEFMCPGQQNGYVAKFFLWDSVNGMVPLEKVIE